MDSFQVDTVCPEISAAIQKVAFANGYEWPDGGAKIQFADMQYLTFNLTENRTVRWSSSIVHFTDLGLLSIPEAIARLKQPRTKWVKVRDIKTHCPSPVEWQAIVKTYPDLEIELPA